MNPASEVMARISEALEALDRLTPSLGRSHAHAKLVEATMWAERAGHAAQISRNPFIDAPQDKP